MRTIIILILLAGCNLTFGQQSYVKTEPSPGENPFWSTNIANVLISNVTFHGKVTFINNSNSPSLWNTNGSGLYAASDSHAHSIRFGSNNVMGTGVRHSVIFGTFNTNGAGSWSSTISGGSNNWIFTSAVAATISGGTEHLIGSSVLGATIGGGVSHQIDSTVANYATISGGLDNRVFEQYGTIGGGSGNLAESIGSTIGGGVNNRATRGDYTTVVGGEQNIARGDWAFLGGGNLNTMSANASGSDGLASAIVAGVRNLMGAAGTVGASYSFIGGGRSNNIPDVSDYGVIVGGSFNQVGGGGNQVFGNFIGGGFNNLTDDQIDFSTIGGGVKNRIGADWGAILGGVSNNVTATYAMAVGNFITNATTKSVEIGPDNLGKVRFTTRNSGSQMSLGDTNGLGGRINLYASTNSGAAVLYVEGSPTSQTTPPSSVTTNLSIAGLATLHISNGIIYAVTGP